MKHRLLHNNIDSAKGSKISYISLLLVNGETTQVTSCINFPWRPTRRQYPRTSKPGTLKAFLHLSRRCADPIRTWSICMLHFRSIQICWILVLDSTQLLALIKFPRIRTPCGTSAMGCLILCTASATAHAECNI